MLTFRSFLVDLVRDVFRKTTQHSRSVVSQKLRNKETNQEDEPQKDGMVLRMPRSPQSMNRGTVWKQCVSELRQSRQSNPQGHTLDNRRPLKPVWL